MSRRSALSRSWSVMGLAVLSLAVAGCSGGTPLRFALSSISGVAISPRKEDGGRPLAGGTVSVSTIGASGNLTPAHVSGPIKTDAAGTFAVPDVLPGQTVLVQVVGSAPTAQDTTTPTLTVTAVVPIPPPPAPDQPPPAVSETVGLISDLAAGAVLQLIKQGVLTPAQLTRSLMDTLESISRQVATNNCLIPGQPCSGVVGGAAAPSRDDLINEVVQQALQTPGALQPPDTGGVGVIVR